VTGRYVAPHEATLRRAIRSVDPDQLDRVLGGWLAEQTYPASGNSGDQQLPAVAVDGTTLRGARGANGRPVQLFAAMLHGQARSSPNAKSTTPPTRSPSSARCWTTWTCVAWS
jgi:hypothetical protein